MQPISRQGLRFLKTELSTGMMYARLASESLDISRAARCTNHARVAYETATKAAAKVEIEEFDRVELDKRFQTLRAKLHDLGIAV